MMRALKVSLTILLSGTFLSCASKPPVTSRRVAATPSNFSMLVDEAQKEGNLPAIGVMIKKQEEVIYLNAQGKRSLQNEAKVSVSDVWHLGSDTKAMTAFLIALAVQEGRLTFQSKIVDLLGKKTKVHALNQDLTLLDILSHGSGLKDLPEIQGGQLWKGLSKSQKSLVAQRLELSLASMAEAPHLETEDPTRPFRSFKYANMNYIILGAVLERIYKTSWEDLIKKKLFLPLAMNSCGFGVAGKSEEIEPSQPWPHVFENNQLIGVPPKYKLDNPPMVGPAGTVHCNLEDWQKFVSELIQSWNGKGKILIRKDIIETYFTNAPKSPYTYGGWGGSDEKYKTLVLQHNGSNTFNYAVALFAPERGIIVLITTNSGRPEAEKAMNKLKGSIAESLLLN